MKRRYIDLSVGFGRRRLFGCQRDVGITLMIVNMQRHRIAEHFARDTSIQHDLIARCGDLTIRGDVASHRWSVEDEIAIDDTGDESSSAAIIINHTEVDMIVVSDVARCTGAQRTEDDPDRTIHTR